MQINGYKLNKLLNIDNLKDFEIVDNWSTYNIYCGCNFLPYLKNRTRIEIYDKNDKFVGGDYLLLSDALDLWGRIIINQEDNPKTYSKI